MAHGSEKPEDQVSRPFAAKDQVCSLLTKIDQQPLQPTPAEVNRSYHNASQYWSCAAHAAICDLDNGLRLDHFELRNFPFSIEYGEGDKDLDMSGLTPLTSQEALQSLIALCDRYSVSRHQLRAALATALLLPYA